MIKPGEIQQIAGKAHVRDTQIEKDYILSWILAGIAAHPVLCPLLAFKGGTVLKKFYFKDYRYSEDLDFSLVRPDLSVEQIKAAFQEVCQYIKEEANINISISEFGVHTTGNINFYLQYTGPLGGGGNNKQVKVDISPNEHFCYSVEKQVMFRSYSDIPEVILNCYSLSEILTEKLRSLISRSQPRDYYDLWYLCEIEGMDILQHKTEFETKARHKGLDPNSLQEKLDAKLPNFQARWDKSMKEQIADLPPYDQIHRQLSRHFRRFMA